MLSCRFSASRRGYSHISVINSSKVLISFLVPKYYCLRSQNAEIRNSVLPSKLTFFRLYSQSTSSIPSKSSHQQLSTVSPAVVNQKMRLQFEDLIQEGDIQKAEEFLREMRAKGYLIDHITTRSLIKGYGKLMKPEDARRIFMELSRYNISPDLSCYHALMNAYAQSGLADKAFEIFELMKSYQIVPTVISYNILIHAYVRSCDPYKASSVLQEMISKGIRPDVVSYSTLIKGYATVLQPQEAEKILIDMRSHGLHGNVFTYSSLINSYSSCELPHDAERIYNQMVHEEKILPTIDCLTSIIKSYSISKLPYDCERILKEYVTQAYQISQKSSSTPPASISYMNLPVDLRPDITCFNTVMNAFTTALLPKEAERVLRELIHLSEHVEDDESQKKNIILPDLVSYTTIMNGYVLTSEPHEAERIFTEITSRGISPNIPSLLCYRHVLDLYLNQSLPSDAERVLHRLEGYPSFLLSTKLYNNIIKSYVAIKQPYEAEKLLNHFISMSKEEKSKISRAASNLISYNLVIMGYSQAGLPHEAERILRNLFQSKMITPSVDSYRAVLEGYSRQRMLDDANRILEEMIVSGYLGPSR